jgi:DNA polymerase III delta prime subunit
MIHENDINNYYNKIKDSLKNKLFNLSKRNNLFHFKPRASHFNLSELSNDFTLNKDFLKRINNEMILNNSFDVVPYVNKLNKIKNRANKFKQTYGYSNLKMVVATMSWRRNNETINTPMLFLDVILERKKGQVPRFEIKLNHSKIETNPAIQYFFNNEYGIELQDNYNMDDDGIHLFLSELYNQVKSQTNFELKAFLSKESKEQNEHCLENGNVWCLDFCNMFVGEFDYKNMNMVKDYDYYIDNNMNCNNFMSLYSLKPKKFITNVPKLPIAQQFNVCSSDKTQNEAIAYSRTGENFIIQGPPGTGKSQTITNLIADFVARGKKVLFVCEKRVALEVVERKLNQFGLGAFTCLLSDVEKDKKAFIERLKENYETAIYHKYGSVSPKRNEIVNKLNNFLSEIANSRYVGDNKSAIEYVLDNQDSNVKVSLDNMVNNNVYLNSQNINESIDESICVYDEFLKINSELIKDYLYGNVNNKLSGNDIARKILEHEFVKKRKQKSIRSLVEEQSKDLIFDLVPVWLMNVSTVSEALPLDFNGFDVVIFDEASQIKVEQAVPVLYRAKQFIAVGDEQQLSPTSFFSKKSSDEEEVNIPYGDNELTIEIDSDSLLEQSNKNISSLMLQFHYRSQQPELIEFSNKYFYDGKLLTVPSEIIQDFDSQNMYDKSISFDYVENGLYTDRKNNKEAVRIADLVRNIKKTSSDSIGVVAFSEAQQKEIEAEILKLQLEDPEFSDLIEDDESIFVKNLENVQGDERDIIIVSICYGYNKENNIGDC